MEHFGSNPYQIIVCYIFIYISNFFLFIYLASINSIRTTKTHKFVDKQCLTVEDLLEANIGQDVQLLVTDTVFKTKEWISGKVKSLQRAQQLPDGEDTDVANAQLALTTPHPAYGE
jgi:hypothetical protein